MRFSCPTCSQLMECADDLAGQKAICPKCSQKVLIPTPPGPPPSPKNKTTLGKIEDDQSGSAIPVATHAGAGKATTDEAFPDPMAPLVLEQNRGIAILVLGIVSCSCCFVALVGTLISPIIGIVVAVAALPTGIVAWVLGNQDRIGIREKRLSTEGANLVLAGYICGIVGTSLATLIIVTCTMGMLFCFAMIFRAAHRQPW